MRPRKEISESQREELQEQLGKSTSQREFQRIQCVLLRALGLDNATIAQATSLKPISIAIFQSRFFTGGVAALLNKPKGGRYHQNMTVIEEADLLSEFLKKANAGQILVVAEVKETYELALGRTVSPMTVYRVLKRHGWRKIAPRPRHPKADPQLQEDFKKTPRPNWPSPPRTSG